MIKNRLFILAILGMVLLNLPSLGQNTGALYNGAVATQASYKALYILDENDPQKIKMTLRNIDNALSDDRLKGKLSVELVSFAAGYAVFEKSGPYESILLDLQKKGLILAQCSNTIKERKIDKSTLFPFIGYVPSGNGEIIIRGAEGWVIIHP